MEAIEFGNDIKGREDLFDDKYSKIKEDTNIGDKPEHFEIIKLIGKGAFGKVYKVRSKLNNQIYAMKIFDKNIEKVKSNLSIKFSHPNIIRIFTSFEVEKKLYIIMEYMNNGNLKDFIILNKVSYLEEEQAFSLLLQSVWALYYIHYMQESKIILRNIKPENILIDDNMKIKLGEFLGTQIKGDIIEEHPYDKNEDILEIWEETKKYMSKNLKGKYNDVYSLGKVLEELLKGDNKIINGIIREMCSDDQVKISTNDSNYIFEKVSQYYSEKQDNSSIDAIVLCLNSFEKLTNDIIDNFKKSTNNDEVHKNEVTNKYHQLIKLINDEGGNFIYWNRYINELRIALMKEVFSSEGINVLEPNKAYLYLINIIISVSLKDYLIKNPSKMYLYPNIVSKQDSEVSLIKSNRFKYINENFDLLENSIAKQFLGLIRIKSTCKDCKLTKYEFKNFLMIDFNPIEFFDKKENNGKIDIDKIINIFKEEIIYTTCEQCYKVTEHTSIKEVYTLPDSLAINVREIPEIPEFDVYNNRFNIKEEIELNDLDKNTDNNKKKYELVAFIRFIKKKGVNFYYSYCKFKGNWFCSQRYKGIEPIKMTDTHRRSSNVRMIFYRAV